MRNSVVAIVAIAALLFTSCESLRGGSASEVARVPGWTLLEGNKSEPADYGLYTYVLFGTSTQASDSAVREKQQRVLRAFLEKTPPLPSFGNTSTATKLEMNVVLLPVQTGATAIPDTIDRQVAFLMKNYNMARSQQLLAHFPSVHTTAGPYLVAVAHPLGDSRNEHFVFIDLTPVAGNDEPLWVDEFLNQVKQPRFWDEDRLHELALKFRNQVTILAASAPAVLAAIDTVVQWLAKNPLKVVPGS